MKPLNSKEPQTYGYVRVSTKRQNINRQLDAMHALGLDDDHIVIDRASGKNFDRPGYRMLIRRLKAGDTVLFHSLDRFGRDFINILSEWITITSKLHVNFKVLDSDILSTNENMSLEEAFAKALTLLMQSYSAAKERLAIKTRQKQGILSAKARGVKLGRPRNKLPDNFEEVYQLFLKKEITGYQAADKLHMTAATFYRIARERKAAA
ncbi:MAG: recombinase family protein [Desulfovibrio sp.]|nr:recombinase family protein [Desulfovibrio sp.]